MIFEEGSEEGRTLSDVQSSQEIWQGLHRNKVGGISKTVSSGGIPSPIQLLSSKKERYRTILRIPSSHSALRKD